MHLGMIGCRKNTRLLVVPSRYFLTSCFDLKTSLIGLPYFSYVAGTDWLAGDAMTFPSLREVYTRVIFPRL